MAERRNKIGIFAGSFDPIHVGHVGVAKQAYAELDLDAVYFMVEERPWTDKRPTELEHRIAMVNAAIRDDPKLRIIQLPDSRFTLKNTLPKIQQLFSEDDLCFLLGSDIFLNMDNKHWPGLFELLDHQLAVFLRGKATAKEVVDHAAKIKAKVTILESEYTYHRSSDVRMHFKAFDIWVAESVNAYIQAHQLYTAEK